eukprot:21681_4
MSLLTSYHDISQNWTGLYILGFCCHSVLKVGIGICSVGMQELEFLPFAKLTSATSHRFKGTYELTFIFRSRIS